MFHLSHLKVVMFHAHKVDVVILTPKVAGLIGASAEVYLCCKDFSNIAGQEDHHSQVSCSIGHIPICIQNYS